MFNKSYINNEQYRSWIKIFAEGNINYLGAVYSIFAVSDDKTLIGCTGAEIGRFTADLGIIGLIRQDYELRHILSFDRAIEWKNFDLAKKKRKFLNENDYIYSLILGSIHPNGHYRERCVKAMARIKGTLPYVLLRVKDWVEKISSCAYTISLDKLQSCGADELIQSAPVIDVLRNSGRVERARLERIAELYKKQLSLKISGVDLTSIHLFELPLRKKLYKLIVSGKILKYSELLLLMKNETDPYCKRLLTEGIFACEDCPEDAADSFMHDKSTAVRSYAIHYKYAAVKNYWEGLEDMLLDKNSGISGFAAYIIGKYTDMSVLSLFISHLKDGSAQAVRGIGYYGEKEDVKLIEPFFKSEKSSLVCAAIDAAARLIGEDGADMYFEFLKSKVHSVAKSAYKAIKYTGLSYGIQREYELCRDMSYPHRAHYALELLLRENTWHSLPYLLYLYDNERFAGSKYKIGQAIAKRSPYCVITQAEADLTAHLAEQSTLGKHEKERLLFDIKHIKING